MAFAENYRKTSTSSGGFASNYRKNEQGIAPKVRKTRNETRPRGENNPNYKKAIVERDKAVEAANYANSPKGIALDTKSGLKDAAKTLGKEALQNPVSTAKSIGTGVYRGLVKPVIDLPALVMKEPKAEAYRKKTDVKGAPENSTQDAIRKSFEMASVVGGAVESIANAPKLASNLVGLLKKGKSTAPALSYSSGQGTRRQVLAPQTALVTKTNQPLEILKSASKQSKTNLAPNLSTRQNPLQIDVASYRKTTPKMYPSARKAFMSGETILNRSGAPGKALAETIRRTQLDEDLTRGQYLQKFELATKGLSKNELENVTDVLEGKAQPVSARASKAAQEARKIYDEVAQEAQKQNFEIRVPGGVSVPFKPRENYAPRIYKFDELTKAGRREELLQHLVDSGQARNKAEAAKLFDDFISANAQRRAGNLENARMLDLPGYEKNAKLAGEKYLSTVSKRFAEARNFGKKDEIAANLIDQIANEDGDYQEAQRIFDMLTKGEEKNKMVQAALKFNTLTKLSLSFFSNATQSVNVAAKGGVRNLAKGMVKGFTKEGDDLTRLAGAYNDPIIIQETGIDMGKVVNFVMKPFQVVERFNRRTAANTGAEFAKDLVKKIAKNPDDAEAIRHLESLGLDPVKLVSGKLTERDILTAANNMVRKTQFMADAFNLPPAWKTPTGKLLTQFKNFSFMQTKFIREEIAKEAAKGNFKPLVRFLLIAPTASFVSQTLRNRFNAVDAEKDPSFRKWDLYRKASGDIPTDLLTQLNYARTSQNKDEEYGRIRPIRDFKNYTSSFLGPTIGTVLDLAASGESASLINKDNQMYYKDRPLAQKDPFLDTKRTFAGMVPFFGRRLINSVFDYGDTPAQEAKKKAIEGIKKGDWNMVKEAQEEDPYLRKQGAFQNLLKAAGKEHKNLKDQKLYEGLYEERKKKEIKPFYTP